MQMQRSLVRNTALTLAALTLLAACSRSPTPNAVDPSVAAKSTNEKIAAATQATATEAALTAEQVYAKVSGAVVLVLNPQASSLGSGVEIAENVFVTNCHVLEDGRRFSIKRKQREVPAQLIAGDTERDVCLLSANDGQSAPVATRSASTVRVGENVFAIGNPQGLEQTLSQGIVSALRRNGDEKALPYIQTTAPISQGSSGGGLFDSQGRLIGIPSFMSAEGQNLNFAAPVDWALDIQARGTKNFASRSQQGPVVEQESPEADSAVAVDSRAGEYHARGLELIADGRVRMALPYLSRAVAMEPRNVTYVTELGNAYMRVGDLGSAQNALNYSLKLDDQQPRAWILMAQVMTVTGRQEFAIESVVRAVQASPDQGAVIQGLSEVADDPSVPRPWRETLMLALKAMSSSASGF